MNRICIVLLFLNFGVVFANQGSVKKQRIENLLKKGSLSIEQKEVLKAYKAVVLLDSVNDLAQIHAYDVLYKKADIEYEKTKESVLFRKFSFDYTGIPLIIAQIARDSDTISDSEKEKIVRLQKERSSNERIDAIIVEQMINKKNFNKAVYYCNSELQKGRENIRPLLIKSRLSFQFYLINKALHRKGIETWDPSIISFYQLKHAIIDAEEGIEKNPKNYFLYEPFLKEQFENFEAINDALEFYNHIFQCVKIDDSLKLNIAKEIDYYNQKQKKRSKKRDLSFIKTKTVKKGGKAVGKE